MKIVTQMIVRNEADVIEECIGSLIDWGVEELVVLDGASDDGTREILRDLGSKVDLDLLSRPDPGNTFADSFRNELLGMTVRHNPDWILSVDADEIYATNPYETIRRAADRGGNVVRSFIPQFWVTIADVRAGWAAEAGMADKSVQERRRWYSWGHMGTFAWLVDPDHYYPQDVAKRTPELPDRNWREWQKDAGLYTICKHYPFRTIEQSAARAHTRRRRGGRGYFGKYFLDWIIDEEACKLTRYDGERWNTFNNHQLVCDYMGRALR